jgi:hypothetical protein
VKRATKAVPTRLRPQRPAHREIVIDDTLATPALFETDLAALLGDSPDPEGVRIDAEAAAAIRRRLAASGHRESKAE